MKSPRPTPPPETDDDLLAALNPSERALLTRWFRTEPIEVVADLCAKPAPEGLDAIFSCDALEKWEHAHCRDNLDVRQERAAELIDHLEPASGATRESLDASILHALKLRLLHLATRPQSNVNDLKTLFLLSLEARNHQLAERKLQISLDEVAADLSDKAKILTLAQLQQHTRELLGDFVDPSRNPTPILNPQSTPL